MDSKRILIIKKGKKMKTQAVSNQSFTAGKIQFINKHFVKKPFDKISLYIPERIGKQELQAASQKLNGKDYDVFVYRNDKDISFFEVRADKDYYAKTKQKPVLIHEYTIGSLFSEAVESAIEAYENAIKMIK
jgi:hypothetical protein